MCTRLAEREPLKRRGIEASCYAPHNDRRQGVEYGEDIRRTHSAGEVQDLHRHTIPTSIPCTTVAAKPVKWRGIDGSCYAPHNDSRQGNAAFVKTTRQNLRNSHSSEQLPYKVQHRVFTAIQTILEESCYAYAEKWLPHVLKENNWTCSEAVEMADWKTTLSQPLPEESITLSGHYSLKQRLGEAVKIRNITTHRQPCSNDDIRSMISSAQSLVEIFRDTDRRQKLERLREEIADCERLNNTQGVQTGGSVVASDPRMTLHHTLDEVTGSSEVFDEMDWAPVQVVHITGEELGDQMDWEQ